MFNTRAIWDPVRAALERLPAARGPRGRCADAGQHRRDGRRRLGLRGRPARGSAAGGGRLLDGRLRGALELRGAPPRARPGLGMVDSAAGVETPETLVVREKTIAALERNFARTVEGIIPFSLAPRPCRRRARWSACAMMHAVGAAAAIRQTRADAAPRPPRLAGPVAPPGAGAVRPRRPRHAAGRVRGADGAAAAGAPLLDRGRRPPDPAGGPGPGGRQNWPPLAADAARSVRAPEPPRSPPCSDVP